ncbi:MAG: phosphodiester glycosidase family protein [Deltaproteobacteria bacterium]|nr:phosphodiester glycosidase family protein [Deltaproteobacteria bacterium]
MSTREAHARRLPSLLTCAALITLACALSHSAPRRSAEAQGPGVTLERVHASLAPTLPIGDRQITLVRVDLRRYRLRFVTEAREGARRTIPRWVADEGLAGATNAGMFLPSGRSVGFMQRAGEVVSNRIVSRFRGLLAFDPRQRSRAGLTLTGPACGQSLERARRAYRNVLSAYRLLDCHGGAVGWNNRKRYSAAGVGVDREGRAVFMHTRTPYRMDRLSRMLAAPELGLRGMIFVEGGPEASLYVHAEGVQLALMGSYEDGFHENDDNHIFWDVPNLIAFEAR